MAREDLRHFVPADTAGTRKDTATLLVGTATEFGLVVRHHIASARDGYYISDELDNLIYEDSDEETLESEERPEKPAPKKAASEKSTSKKTTSKKTSGNRAEKTSTDNKE